jgi:DNA-binding transcriptional ArsR family regulator
MDAVFKALADESRRKLLDQLHKSNGQTLGELCAHLDMTRQAVTKHLLLLEAANLVAVVWRGRESCITSIQCRFTRSPTAGSGNTNAIAFRRWAI